MKTHAPLLPRQENLFGFQSGQFAQSLDEAHHDDEEDDEDGDADDRETPAGEFGDALIVEDQRVVGLGVDVAEEVEARK